MFFRLFATRLLAIAIVVGLAVAPAAAPLAMRASMADMMAAGISDMSSMADASSMAADMTCCPDEQKGKTCTDCPLTAMCVLATVQAAPPTMAALLVRQAVRSAHTVLDEATADGLDRPPPDQPPRNLA
jgi:hypothetical protein